MSVKGGLPELRLDGDDIPLWNRLSYKQRQTATRGAIVAGAAVTVIVVLFPIYWMFATALAPRSAIFDTPRPYVPTSITLDAFIKVFTESQFPRWYLNSLLVSLGVVVLTTTTATLAGYGLTRINIPRKKFFARIILFGYMFPAILLAIPMFIFWRQIGWVDSLIGLVFAETAVSLPFSIWLMWKFFQTVPYSLEESAYMNGASRFRAFYEIALPMAKPGMVAVGVFSYAISWNQFTMPQVLMVSSDQWVLTQGLFSFTVQNTVLWQQLMAASALTVIPSFFFVFFLQKYLLRGFRSGDIG